jgi:hypothetical protein
LLLLLLLVVVVVVAVMVVVFLSSFYSYNIICFVRRDTCVGITGVIGFNSAFIV